MSNPALDKSYENLSHTDYVLFVDETYNAPGEEMEHTFYTVCGVLIKASLLVDTRQEIDEIVDDYFWHTTDALRTSEGRATAVELLQFCEEVDDLYFVAHKMPLQPGDNMENARQACLRALFSHVENGHNAKLIVMEKRQDNAHDDADRRLLKHLRSERVVSRGTQLLLVSPRHEHLLWLPDLIAMAFRRKITHKDETSTYFKEYVEGSTTVLET